MKDWLEELPVDDKAKLISPELLAAFIDELWKQTAAQDGYEGEPYVSGKITPELVSSVASDFPTIGGTNTGTVGDQNINVDVKLDLGDYPDIKQPTLEEPPSAASILDPIFNLFPSLRGYKPPERSVSCPEISLELWGETYATDLRCRLIEDNRAVLSAAMLLVFTVVSLLIVLGA